VAVRFTLVGDVDLDGQVGVADLGILATDYGTTTQGGWGAGDLNADGAIGVADLGMLATNYGQSLTGGSVATSQAMPSSTAVPEPSAALVLVAGTLASSRRRGRRPAPNMAHS